MRVQLQGRVPARKTVPQLTFVLARLASSEQSRNRPPEHCSACQSSPHHFLSFVGVSHPEASCWFRFLVELSDSSPRLRSGSTSRRAVDRRLFAALLRFPAPGDTA